MKHLYLYAEEIHGLWPLKDDGKMTPEAKKLVKIKSFNHGMSLPTAAMRPSFSDEGFRQGYIEHSPIVIARDLDPCTPKIIEQFVSRTLIKKLQIISCELVEKTVNTKKAAMPEPLWVIRLGHAMITDFCYGPNGDTHQEVITISYRSIQWSFRSLSIVSRKPGGWSTASWDGELNKAGEELPGLGVQNDEFDTKLDDFFKP